MLFCLHNIQYTIQRQEARVYLTARVLSMIVTNYTSVFLEHFYLWEVHLRGFNGARELRLDTLTGTTIDFMHGFEPRISLL